MKRLIATVAAILAGLFAPAAATPAGNANFGINATSSVLQAPNQKARQAALKDIKALGVRYVRIDVTWQFIEPTRGTYNWTFYDAVMGDIRAAGLEPIMLIAYGNTAYGSPTKYDPPTDPADYAAFAGRVANRYKGLGFHVFEVWNEPNLPQFWGGAPNASEYVALLRPAFAAIKAADPQARVLSAGLAPPNMLSYATAMYDAGARGSFDGFALHPYVGSASVDQYHVRTLMDERGDAAVPMWATEAGWSTWVTPGNSEAKQSEYLRKMLLWWREAGGGPFIVYTHKDTATPGGEGAFGLLRLNGSRKPGWTTFRDMVRAG